MRGLLKGLLLALVVVMCVSSTLAVAEGSLLAERMGRAYESGRRVEVALSAKMGGGLALFLPEETFGAIDQLLADTRIVAHWAKDADGNPAMGLMIGIGEAEVLTGTAVIMGGSLAVDTSLLPGKTLVLPLESVTDIAQQQSLPIEIDDEAAALLARAYETYFGIVMGWTQENEGLYEPVEGPIFGSTSRSEAAEGINLRATAVQLKDLLVRLTQEFENDTDLQQALDSYSEAGGGEADSMAEVAKDLADLAQALEPMDGALALDAYTDADGNLVGVDFEMEPLFEGMAGTAYARYDRLDEDGRLAHDFQGRIGLDEGGQAAAVVSFVALESHAESKITQDMLLRGMMQPTAEDAISQVTLTDARETVLDQDQERLVDTIEFTMESLAPDGSAPDEASMPMSASLGTQSVTNAREGDDFDANISVSVQAMGMEFATLQLRLSSDAYAPADTSGSTVIDLSTATPEEQAALTEELEMELGLAVMGAMQALPPELLAMMSGE